MGWVGEREGWPVRENGQKRRKKKGQAQLSSELFLILHEVKLSTSHHYWPHWLKLLGNASQQHLEGYNSFPVYDTKLGVFQFTKATNGHSCRHRMFYQWAKWAPAVFLCWWLAKLSITAGSGVTQLNPKRQVYFKYVQASFWVSFTSTGDSRQVMSFQAVWLCLRNSSGRIPGDLNEKWFSLELLPVAFQAPDIICWLKILGSTKRSLHPLFSWDSILLKMHKSLHHSSPNFCLSACCIGSDLHLSLSHSHAGSVWIRLL